jgi:gliding motility-associated-like protein
LKYSVTNCDSVYRIVNLTVQTTTTQATNPKICPGQTYTLPWGTIVSTTGTYRDTLRYTVTNCDSVYRIVNLTVQTVTTQTTNPKICAGQTYTLPWGTIVSAAGTYRDTLRYTITNCDSIYRIVNVTVQTTGTQTMNAKFCAGQTFTLPWGAVVNTSGTYKDTLRYSVTNCDSIYRVVNLTVQAPITITANPKICTGQTYVLPWGAIVSAGGTYKDTLKYASGCDSTYRIINLTVQSPTSLVLNPGICAGQTYTLPWGTVVSTPGTYKDTLKYSTGCDSLYRTVNLSLATSQSQSIVGNICSGKTYTLPWGTVVSSPGVYKDTLKYTTGCDSLYRTVTLFVQSAAIVAVNPKICSGQSYTLPWGSSVTSSGTYRDTLKYSSGCDSLYRIVNLVVQSASTISSNPKICFGQSYTLPWGTIVSASGTYKDTLRYTTGCDSIYRIVNLVVQTSTVLPVLNPVICNGQAYSLPWGATASATGIYKDTLRYTTGCDSVYRTVNLLVLPTSTITVNPKICNGQSYLLPWGNTVAVSGTFRDTLRYVTGCDSVYRIVNLVVQTTTSITVNPKICAGQTYTLPWGTNITATGTYRDTLRYTTGCDSVMRIVNLVVQPVISTPVQTVTICNGQSFTLPWGKVVTASGIYRDTIRYEITGCDSLRSVVNLTVQSPVTINTVAAICQGQNFTLPWGTIVAGSGIYRDTLRFKTTNCDSLYRIVQLTVTPALITNISASVCTGERYQLPWGSSVVSGGIYKDTIRSSNGCDSLIRTVTLTIKPNPTIRVTKSNDVNCILGTSKLNAYGGLTYQWTPVSSLTNPAISNPVASPESTTMYYVVATSANGCTGRDSVLVSVTRGDLDKGFLLPNAFTPNSDGLNDCFGVKTWGQVTNLKFDIYNRWGELVFRTSDPSQCWNGLYKGFEQPPGIFTYHISADTYCGNVVRSGFITLVR